MQRAARLQRTAAWAIGQPVTFPMVPDAKDWTWVLDRACPDCGFDASTCPCTHVAAVIRALVDPWRRVLARTDVAHRVRPDRWSALEYACHVRDVFVLYDERLHLML